MNTPLLNAWDHPYDKGRSFFLPSKTVSDFAKIISRLEPALKGDKNLMKSLIPWTWGAKRVPVAHNENRGDIYSLQNDMNLLFERFLRSAEFPFSFMEDQAYSSFMPKVDLKETNDELQVTAEVPGMTEKDLEVLIANSVLTIKGEKTEEREENVKGYYRMERSYGTFSRAIPLPVEVDEDKVMALFKNGVLKVTMHKMRQEKSSLKTIPVRSE